MREENKNRENTNVAKKKRKNKMKGNTLKGRKRWSMNVKVNC